VSYVVRVVSVEENLDFPCRGSLHLHLLRAYITLGPVAPYFCYKIFIIKISIYNKF
jgi:hypothetical protein